MNARWLGFMHGGYFTRALGDASDQQPNFKPGVAKDRHLTTYRNLSPARLHASSDHQLHGLRRLALKVFPRELLRGRYGVKKRCLIILV